MKVAILGAGAINSPLRIDSLGKYDRFNMIFTIFPLISEK